MSNYPPPTTEYPAMGYPNTVIVVTQAQVPVITSQSKILDRSLFTRKEYLILCAGVLIQAFMYSFEVNLMYNALGYVTGYFTASSIATILPVILQIISAALVPLYTKVSDVFGRAESLTAAMVLYLVGYAIQGNSQAFAHLAIGQIFYGMGSTGMLTLTQVLIADTTKLINRGIMFSLWDLPSAINIFTTQVLADPMTIPKGDDPKDKWRQVYLTVGVLSLVGAIAVLVPLWYLQRKAERKAPQVHQRRSLMWLLHEFDVVGALLITLAMSLTLLPMILAKSFQGNWENPSILGMFFSGIFFFILLILWEAKYTDKPIMSMKIWSNPTAFGGLVVCMMMTVMAAMNWQYFTLYLVVSRNLSFGDALMLERGYQVAYLVFQFITALMMKRWNITRPFVWIGIFIHTAGIGMMIPARLPTSSDALVVISQTIVGAAGGMANIASNVLVTGVVAKKDVATVVGATQIMGSFGSAFGAALAGGVWTQYLPTRLAKHITGPYDEYLSMNDPLTYIPGLDPTTKAQLVEAYSDSQLLMSIISCALAVTACGCALMMKPIDLHADQPDDEPEATGAIVMDENLVDGKIEVK
ncbi:hypothetical protein BGW38_010313 [Lunasporangiospora selenospora]|uniref:Major facilitator superfamily (MFS) profile domain-containing protein n=1 Tax=Lunasporangiospora selenospora TaxID=979761 RepID=A0A9P6KFK4_9FUNG|nr:hypothetical protein BGW38_010313 [Lunasporangiospora selenospora]